MANIREGGYDREHNGQYLLTIADRHNTRYRTNKRRYGTAEYRAVCKRFWRQTWSRVGVTSRHGPP